MKVELHMHSKKGSPCGQLEYEELLGIYKNLGYGALTLTEHFSPYIYSNFLKGRTHTEKVDEFVSHFETFRMLAEKYGIKAFFGAELGYNFDDGTNCDLLAIGVDESFFTKDILYMNVKKLYSHCNERGVFLSQAHPFRPNIKLMPTEYLDAVEVYNGLGEHLNNNDLALKYAEKFGKTKLSGSDCHQKHHAGRGGIIVPDGINSAQELVYYLKNNQPQLIKDGVLN